MKNFSPPNDWEYLGEGRHRKVYGLPSGRNVIKVPIGQMGKAANLWEAIVWKTRHNQAKWPWMLQNELRGIVPARCRLIPGTYLLVMERLEEILHTYNIKRSPHHEWVNDVDCFQVGFDRQDKVKAFDFAQFENYAWREAIKELSKLQPKLEYKEKDKYNFQFKLMR
jgi:hypothetical protein